MDFKTLIDTPPWDWPNDAGKMFQKILNDSRAQESDRLMAAELAGDSTVINDDLADALTDAAEDPAVAVVVLSGSGRAFSTGADLKALALPRETVADGGGGNGFDRARLRVGRPIGQRSTRRNGCKPERRVLLHWRASHKLLKQLRDAAMYGLRLSHDQ